MALLDRSEWYDIARETNWTPSFVAESELFPDEMSDPYDVPVEAWETFDEPYKISYRQYVNIQREKDAAAYSVKAALSRQRFYESADVGYLNLIKMHYAAIALSEYAACHSDARMTRFGRAPGMRNMATFGMLDEMRHGQIQLWFPHELVGNDRQFDWAHEAHHSKNWAILAARHSLDDVMMSRDANTTAMMLNFAFEVGLTNIQMIGLANDAANMGDYTFQNLITSIQSDEARHAQIGVPVIEIMIENGKKAEAQYAVDVAFWRIWRIFAIAVGVPMDYYIPLEKRERSFKEYMHEFVITQYERQLRDVGLDRPWYWDLFLDDIENHHHCQQGGHLVLARDGVVASGRRGQPAGAGVARGEVSGLERDLRLLLGRHHRSTGERQGGDDAPELHADLLQRVPVPDLQPAGPGLEGAGPSDGSRGSPVQLLHAGLQMGLRERRGALRGQRDHRGPHVQRNHPAADPGCGAQVHGHRRDQRGRTRRSRLPLGGPLSPGRRRGGIGPDARPGRTGGGRNERSPPWRCCRSSRAFSTTRTSSRSRWDTDFTMDQVAAACAEHCINHHVKDQPGKRLRVRRTTEDDSAEPLPPEMTVAEAGLQMYDCLDIYFEG